MVTVLHLMLRHFHHFTELKKNFGNQTSLATIYILYNTITVQVFLLSIKDLQRYGYIQIIAAVVIHCAAGETKFGKCEK